MIVSAGVLVHRLCAGAPEFLLCHPGGPFWAKKDLGSWTVPKGLVEPGEAPRSAAVREFGEETGLSLTRPLSPLKPVRQAGGKWVHCWSVEEALDLSSFHSESFQMEWPPKSGRLQSFPEIDRIAYFAASEALIRILRSQACLIEEVLGQLA